MESIAELISWQRVTATVTVYVASLVIYRLFLHPLSHIPGPKLAATTRWYEAYYDVIKGGRYTFQIEKMHKQYGTLFYPFSGIYSFAYLFACVLSTPDTNCVSDRPYYSHQPS